MPPSERISELADILIGRVGIGISLAANLLDDRHAGCRVDGGGAIPAVLARLNDAVEIGRNDLRRKAGIEPKPVFDDGPAQLGAQVQVVLLPPLNDDGERAAGLHSRRLERRVVPEHRAMEFVAARLECRADAPAAGKAVRCRKPAGRDLHRLDEVEEQRGAERPELRITDLHSLDRIGILGRVGTAEMVAHDARDGEEHRIEVSRIATIGVRLSCGSSICPSTVPTARAAPASATSTAATKPTRINSPCCFTAAHSDAATV